MNSFPWWDKTLTIFNKYVDPNTQRVTWYKQTLTNCFWKYVNKTYYVGSSSSSGISLESKEIICRIPKDVRFVDKREWKELADRTANFTLGNGDIIVLGEVDDVIDEYTKGQRSTDLVAKYKELQGCLEIDTYVINDYVGVKLEHYRVIGA